ncbi:hypothetical protein NJB95_22830, partial [Brucella intermedia]|nr:hypothetical protein [Brucella intermedia]
ASRRSLRAYASSGAFQRPLQRLNSLLQGGPLFRGQATEGVPLAMASVEAGYQSVSTLRKVMKSLNLV